MSESKRNLDGIMSQLDGRRISRRTFLQNMTAVSVTTLAGVGLLEACSAPPATSTIAPTAPAPAQPAAASATPGSAAILEAFKKRKSATAFLPQSLPKEKLLELLWAAWGINRPDSGKRTAPSAMNTQEIDIYVLLSEGVFVYDAKGNQLVSISTQDLRARAAMTPFMKEAPVHLLFVADYAKFRALSQSEKDLFSAAHTGFIGQNVYLYCAAEGLAARFHASLNRAGLKENLKLREDQAIVFAQVVGYPKE